jgi:hypothetical protein
MPDRDRVKSVAPNDCSRALIGPVPLVATEIGLEFLGLFEVVSQSVQLIVDEILEVFIAEFSLLLTLEHAD